MSEEGVTLVKIGGSTLGAHDTTLEDAVALQSEGKRVVVVHGGGAIISRWLDIHGVPSRFVRGLRVTDERAMPVVTAVLAGVVNKELVAQINALGGRAVGLCGADGGLLRARVLDPELGYVGEVSQVDAAIVLELLEESYIPVIASIGLGVDTAGKPQLLNINADTVAGELAFALAAQRLIFLTDVPGVLDSSGQAQRHLGWPEATAMLAQGAIAGGMIPKVEACLRAAAGRVHAVIVDGREPHALLAAVRGGAAGTVVG